MNADTTPRVRRGQAEISPDADPLRQPGELKLDGPNLNDRKSESIEALDAPALNGDWLSSLAFNEEPVTIRIEQANVAVDDPPTSVYIAVNNKGAEVFDGKRWFVVGWLPIGEEVTTRRKYAEVLLRSNQIGLETKVKQNPGQNPDNSLRYRSTMKYPISIIEDKNPKGREWVRQIRAEG